MDTLRFDTPDTGTIDTLDLGTVGPSSSDDTQMHVYNTSDQYQAEDVTVKVSTDGDSIQLWLSTDGDTFSASISIGDIPPGGFSPTFYLRRVTPASATGACQGSIIAQPASWTSNDDHSTTESPLLEED